MKKIVFFFFLGLIAFIFIGTAVFLYNKSQEKPVIYQTTQAFQTSIVKKTVATGKILPRKEIEIKPQVSGVIDTLFIEAGDQVKKGDLLARIELIPNMEHLSSAESQLETARINLRNATLEYEKQKELYEKKLISEIEYNKFVLNFQLQQEAVNSAENNVALIKEGASKKSGKVANLVRSTIDGMVLVVPFREGTFVTETNTFNQGTTIANIANMQDLLFVGKLDESEIGKVKEGMELILNIGAIEGQSFKAALEYISPKGEDDQGTIKFEIKAAIETPQDTFLRAGYSANADIVLAKKDNVLAINEGDLILENGKAYVEVETGEQEFEKQEVSTGISDGINIEILSGIDLQTKFKKLVK
ncbi:Macrolide export protein MacA [Thalassocella blandensis]|nr:Macrolide export protein MacA [Thalassocella blandensis]